MLWLFLLGSSQSDSCGFILFVDHIEPYDKIKKTEKNFNVYIHKDRCISEWLLSYLVALCMCVCVCVWMWTCVSCTPLLPFVQVTRAILDSGKAMGSQAREGPPLMYLWHNKKYLGAAHGLAGILFTLLLVKPEAFYVVSWCWKYF